MKILVVHNAYQAHNIGGEEVVVRQEVAQLKKTLGVSRVFEYTLGNDTLSRWRLAFQIWGNRRHAHAIHALVKKYGIDLVHVHNFFPLFTPLVFKAAKLAGAQVVHTLHNYRWWCIAGTFYLNKKGLCEKCAYKKWAWAGVYHRCYRHSFLQSMVAALAFAWYRQRAYTAYIDAFFVLSLHQKAKLKTLIDEKKLYLKPNFIDRPVVSVFPEEKKHYLFIGRLEESKGIEVLLQVWKTLPKHFHLKVIGNGNARQMNAQSNIRFLGALPHAQVLAHLESAKYLVHCALAYETFGLTILEAFARKTPVIGFALGTRLTFIQSGKNGFLCTPETLRSTLLTSFAYPEYASLCTAAGKSAEPYYAARVVEQQLAIYQSILNKTNV